MPIEEHKGNPKSINSVNFIIALERIESKISHRKYDYAFKTKNKKEKDVIVCEAENDCVIQSNKPLFIHLSRQDNQRDLKSKSYCLYMEDSETEDEISCISVKDIKDLNLAMKLVEDFCL